MKNIFAIIISLLIGHSAFGQKTPISFVNNERIKDSSSIGIDWDERISEITLKSKTEFEFRSFPMPSSCLTWREYNGTWEKRNDTLIFSDQYEVVENDARFIFSTKNQNKHYQLEFRTDKNSKLSEKNIEIQLVYDYDADLKDVKRKMELENNFSLKIPFSDIPNRKQLASIRYEYFLPNGEKRYGYITENQTVNKKESDLPNQIGIILVENPKKEIIYRVTKAILKDDEIKIISKEKNKSDLPDYTGEIKFKEFYKKLNAK
ncbi:hypothetical protein [Olleya namhaensis]|uniref:hypothetical protein n=1 Tax=Olleya namhaensis TaxID=1144750 RepID=UPI0023311C6E|nr:hypothetical protein [Olleya namhaensis]